MKQAILDKLAKQLERLIKDEITSQDLVDTGRMRDSILVLVFYSDNEITFQVEAVDYFVYVSGIYGVMENVERSYEWQLAIEEALLEIIELQIEEELI